jgi:hypothetical protein
MLLRALIKIGLLLLVIALLGISGCVLYSFHARRQAQKCLELVRQLDVGSSTAAEAATALKAFRKFETDGTAMIGGQSYPIRTYRIENSGFHLPWILHRARFQTGLTFRDGVLVARGVGFVQEPFLLVSTRESVAGLLPNPSRDEASSGMTVGVYDPPLKMDVVLDSHASAAAHKAAYQYNLACFTSLRACQSVYEILPTIKQQGLR